MPRKLRIEASGAIYHVINRGNYRSNIFATSGARQAFLKTLDEACQKTGWILHAWCLMTNHFHLALSTPQPNLVSGMQWLQATFSARFNRFRKERGHLFQGRYKALIIEPGKHLGAVCHYIHLNPIRAKMMPMVELAAWDGCSLRWLMRPGERAPWFDPNPVLAHPMELPDTPKGRDLYKDYLVWLSTDQSAQKELCFEKLSRGWAIGSKEFRQKMLAEVPEWQIAGVEDADEGRKLLWEGKLAELKAKFSETQRREQAKSADWKVAVATEMKKTTTVSNRWLSEQLGMGSLHTLSRLTGECRKGTRAASHYKALTTKNKT